MQQDTVLPIISKQISVEDGAEGYPVPEKRVNVVVMGVAQGLADAIMLASFDPDDGAIDVLSIPRDTYIERKGYKASANNKINSSYGRGGADSVVENVASLTGVNVHYYVEVDYEAVEALVDSIGGIKVTVPWIRVTMIRLMICIYTIKRPCSKQEKILLSPQIPKEQ